MVYRFLLLLFLGTPSASAELCVVDAINRTLCLSDPAQRAVSLSPGATELLFSAGAGDRVVAVSAWSDYPVEAAELPQVGDSNRLDLEAIVSLAPDLVVAWVDGNSRSQLERLSDLGISVFWLAPRTFDDIAAAVSDLALLTGSPDLGNERAEAFRAEIVKLKAQYADARPVKVFYQIWDQPLMTVNRDELISKAITLCGGVNVFGGLPRLVPRISREAVLEANPEVIITAGSSDDRQWLEAWREFPGLAAVAAGNLFLEPPDLLARPTLRMADGARHLCQTLEQARANL
ncbi:cobalamin-binding protein [Marinobacter manganoxydans]|uniref:Fe3+-hydroxamate ABC transporter periplasmic binding protein n=1 Tax=Marinobacter manganoxydans MnI7-9 TaxID=1094979 RepID=G6YY99_9GAMM|nr:cobalamin-binding protein [Marinobacter manganoxydans]EHJ02702.1 Fe3+-hydroxamate ABC transporter periplasmic binding protein [Marinobacter manganoxydans MnI7-9]MTI77838.1 cobalamin-binding protein [Marinobacter sp.]